MVERDDDINVLGEINVKLESDTNKLIEKLTQEKDSQEEAFEEFNSTLDNKDSPKIDWQDDPLHETEDFFVGLDQSIHIVVVQNNVPQEVAGEVEERRPSKRIRVTQEEMIKDEKSKKG
ncbi:hypothetical protein Tco_0542609 [Tanacetum coccineum]